MVCDFLLFDLDAWIQQRAITPEATYDNGIVWQMESVKMSILKENMGTPTTMNRHRPLTTAVADACCEHPCGLVRWQFRC